MDRLKLENVLYGIILIGSIIFLCTMLFVGCCPVKQTTIVRDTVITVIPPVIHDTVNAVVTDTVVTAIKVNIHDTTAIIKYYPKLKYIDYFIKPDTIKLMHRDTIQITQTKVIGTPFLSKLGLVGIGFIIAGITLIILKIRKII